MPHTVRAFILKEFFFCKMVFYDIIALYAASVGKRKSAVEIQTDVRPSGLDQNRRVRSINDAHRQPAGPEVGIGKPLYERHIEKVGKTVILHALYQLISKAPFVSLLLLYTILMSGYTDNILSGKDWNMLFRLEACISNLITFNFFYFLRDALVSLRSFLCLCLRIFFLRHFTTFPTPSPPYNAFVVIVCIKASSCSIVASDSLPS